MELKPFDPTGISTLLPGQQPSPSQVRFLTMLQWVRDDFKGQDQYVYILPRPGETEKPALNCVKVLTPEHAAQMIYDKQARLATEEEIAKYKVQQEQAAQEAQINIDKQDLAKSMQRILRN